MLKRWRVAPGEALVIVLLALVTGLLFGIVVHHPIFNDVAFSDYSAHIQFARDMLNGKFVLTHAMFHVVVLGLGGILPISYETAAWIGTTGFYILTVLLLYAMIRSAIEGSGRRSWIMAAVFALALLLAEPISLFSFKNHNLYFAYISINAVHNPTIVLLKPFALLLFIFTVAILNHRIRLSARTITLGTLLVALSLFAKPNYVLVLLPALIVVSVYRLWRREFTDLKTLVATLIVPMIVLLVLQYIVMYLLIRSSGSIIFAPLATIYLRDRSRLSIILKFVLSIVFPLVVYLLYWRKSVRDLILNLSWLIFFAGVGQMYLFAEGGPRLPDSNFWWSAEIALFILFIVSTLFWLQRLRAQQDWRTWVCLILFALHLASGVLFILVQIQAHNMAEWW